MIGIVGSAGAVAGGADGAGAGAGAAAGSGSGTTVSAGGDEAGAGVVAALAAGLGLFGFGEGGGSRTSRRFGAVVALPPEARSRGTMSSGTLEEADRPATPISSRVPSSSLLLTPNSFASS
jgi:hypothetical protein